MDRDVFIVIPEQVVHERERKGNEVLGSRFRYSDKPKHLLCWSSHPFLSAGPLFRVLLWLFTSLHQTQQVWRTSNTKRRWEYISDPSISQRVCARNYVCRGYRLLICVRRECQSVSLNQAQRAPRSSCEAGNKTTLRISKTAPIKTSRQGNLWRGPNWHFLWRLLSRARLKKKKLIAGFWCVSNYCRLLWRKGDLIQNTIPVKLNFYLQ